MQCEQGGPCHIFSSMTLASFASSRSTRRWASLHHPPLCCSHSFTATRTVQHGTVSGKPLTTIYRPKRLCRSVRKSLLLLVSSFSNAQQLPFLLKRLGVQNASLVVVGKRRDTCQSSGMCRAFASEARVARRSHAAIAGGARFTLQSI